MHRQSEIENMKTDYSRSTFHIICCSILLLVSADGLLWPPISKLVVTVDVKQANLRNSIFGAPIKSGEDLPHNTAPLLPRLLELRCGASIVDNIMQSIIRNPILILLMVASSLISVYEKSLTSPKVLQAVVQGCIAVYIFLALLTWQSKTKPYSAA